MASWIEIWQNVVHWENNKPENRSRADIRTAHREQFCLVTGGRGSHPAPAVLTGGRHHQFLEVEWSCSWPILVHGPKLRIQFADFPYLHYSIDQRLFTLETCCGYGYEPARVRRHLPGIFKVRLSARGCRENFGTLRLKPKPILRARRFEGLGGLCRKDNSSQGFSRRLPVASRCHDRYEVPNGSAAGFRNMDRIPFWHHRGMTFLRSLRHHAFDQGFP